MSDEETSIKTATPVDLREELIGRFAIEKFGLKKREVSVMTRLSGDIVEILDALVELEIFSSRSEVVAAFIEKTILARLKLFEEIRNQAEEIRRKRESAKKLAFQAVQDSRE